MWAVDILKWQLTWENYLGIFKVHTAGLFYSGEQRQSG